MKSLKCRRCKRCLGLEIPNSLYSLALNNAMSQYSDFESQRPIDTLRMSFKGVILGFVGPGGEVVINTQNNANDNLIKQ